MGDSNLIIVSLVLTLLIAIASAVSAGASWKAARAARDGIKAQIVAALLDEFWSDAFLDAALTLRKWEVEHKDRYVEEFCQHFDDGKPLPSQPKDVRNVDKARRRVKGYFAKIQRFTTRGSLKDVDVQGQLVTKYQVELLLEIVEPLEQARRDTEGELIYSYFADLYPEVNRPMPLDAQAPLLIGQDAEV